MVLNRTIMALWKARSLSPEQKVQIVEEESETKILQTEESGSFLGLDDVSMSEVYSSVLSVPVSYFSLSLSACMLLQACTHNSCIFPNFFFLFLTILAYCMCLPLPLTIKFVLLVMSRQVS
jgi:hypothetical protein